MLTGGNVIPFSDLYMYILTNTLTPQQIHTLLTRVNEIHTAADLFVCHDTCFPGETPQLRTNPPPWNMIYMSFVGFVCTHGNLHGNVHAYYIPIR